MSGDWLAEAARWRGRGVQFVLVTVLSVRGSAPCEPGRRMLVSAEAQHGTVGGGRLEQEVLGQARGMLGGGREPSGMESLSLGSRLGQCCGGRVVVHYEAVNAAMPAVAVFGAGHVGQELVRILSRLPNPVTVVDSRRDWLARLPRADGVTPVFEPEPADAVADLPPGSVCVVLTHSHDIDLEVCRALLRRGDMGTVGVIGSRSKAARFRSRLEERGIDGGKLECPIGRQAGKDPVSVAAGIAARICEALVAPEGGQSSESKEAQRLLESVSAGLDR